MLSSYISLVFEDDVQLNVAKKIIHTVAPEMNITKELCGRGQDYIRRNIRSFDYASRKIHPYVIVTDLDDIQCAPLKRRDWISFKSSVKMSFNIAVREVEAWLLADYRGVSNFFRVSASRIPFDVENIQDPKKILVNLCRKSKSREIRDGVVPGKLARVGPLYNSILGKFIYNHWNLNQARKRSKSLERFISNIESL